MIRRRRWAYVTVGVCALAATAALTIAPSSGPSRSGAAGPGPRSQSARAPAPPGTSARFTYLARQHTNRCDLRASEILSYPATRRMQGSCCTPMVKSSYRRQVSYLKHYARVPEVPADPYDIAAPLAQRLLRYRSVSLTRGERATYRRAMAMTDEKGPCCCHCWRWEAFEGLSKHLIADRHWSAKPLAGLIGALDGCGGSGHARAPPG